MIREFAFGLSNRHYFQPSENTTKFQGMAKDTFVSLYAYDDNVNKYFKEHKTLAGYEGEIYMPDEYLLDVDGSSTEEAKEKTVKLLKLLANLKVPTQIYYSGRGFHIGIPVGAFRWKPSKDLHIKVKEEFMKYRIYDYADPAVTDKTRIIRLTNTLNSKSKRWKIPLAAEEMALSAEEIEELASKPRDNFTFSEECNPIFDVMVREKKKNTVEYKNEIGLNPDPVYYPCIQKMLYGGDYGSRHAIALRLAAWFRWRYPEHVVRLIMENWRERVDLPDKPFTQDELDKIITDTYTGHNGQGYRYGCMDTVMDSLCSSSCTLYKGKKSNDIMTALDMEKHVMDFYKTEVKPIDIGVMYGKNFPIFPGELVVIQAPPKSMKTMLLQNWVNELKRPTYFLELEMSPRQIWQRFIMIEKGWTNEDIKNHYMKSDESVTESFDWLTVDYGACYAVELQKRIDMLPVKPEIIIVDHMGLMLSKHKDQNMKMEEIAGALTELAIKNNVVVFTIVEITKQAFNEGMNISSSRGSFRIAYNASKILSLQPMKNKDGEIRQVLIKTTANREAGNLNVALAPQGVKLIKSDVEL